MPVVGIPGTSQQGQVCQFRADLIGGRVRDPDLNGPGEFCLERVGLVRAQGFRDGLRTEGLSSRRVPDLADRARVGDIKVRL